MSQRYRRTLSLSKKHYTQLEILSSVLDRSMSQIVVDLMDYVDEHDLEEKLWKNWSEKFHEYHTAMDEMMESKDEEE